MPVAFDAVGPSTSGATSATSPLTWSHTCGSGATELLVGVTVDVSAGSTYTATATYNGVAMTSLGVVDTNNSDVGYLEVFSLANPPTGSAYTVSVVVTGSGTLAGVNGGSLSFKGSATLSAIQSAFGNSSSLSLAFAPTASGNIVAAFAGCGSPLTAVSGFVNGYICLGDDQSGAGNVSGGTLTSTGGTVTPAWSNPGDYWAIIAVEVQAPPAPAAVSPSPPLQPPGRMSPMALSAYQPPLPAAAPAAVTVQAAAALDGEGVLAA